MRVLTYNVHGWQGLDGTIDIERLARIIASSQASLVALNEVYHPLVPPGASRPALDQLAADLGMAYAFGVALTPQFAFAPSSAYGNALLTRLPLLAHAGHHLTPVAGREQRGLLEVRVLLPDGRTPFSVYVTHLDHRSEEARMQQLRAVLQWTGRDRDRPHLLMGDFNALAPGDYEGRPGELEDLREQPDLARLAAEGLQVIPRLLRARYSDTGGHGGSRVTFRNPSPRVRIDYIFASQPLAPAVQGAGVWQTADTALASDHLPAWADLAIDRSTQAS